LLFALESAVRYLAILLLSVVAMATSMPSSPAGPATQAATAMVVLPSTGALVHAGADAAALPDWPLALLVSAALLGLHLRRQHKSFQRPRPLLG
jgi:hypothetical protein